ncbi:MAG: hypothetical protein AVDCRST_MAG07-916 [uncultured Frankineae bacterium]|uniref:Major facilitator superfamily (MFS) profile domain-containing protein n=1 Tax=uncultured Frankineae bacterium TaxID=437475 RepID=A0A6J4KVA7_9ACTN|nr:MAG: hypothetical protein AVDCRST_MAG07-916 [uncultured Frankineae bacterium]
MAGLTLLSGLCLLGVAGAETVVLAAAAYAGFYLANAASWPLLHAVLHGRVGASGRATALSASSLSLMIGGGAADLLNPRLVAVAGRPAAYVTAGVVCALAALLALRLPASREQGASADEALHPGHDLVGGVLSRDPGAQGQQLRRSPSRLMPSQPASIVAPRTSTSSTWPERRPPRAPAVRTWRNGIRGAPRRASLALVLCGPGAAT